MAEIRLAHLGAQALPRAGRPGGGGGSFQVNAGVCSIYSISSIFNRKARLVNKMVHLSKCWKYTVLHGNINVRYKERMCISNNTTLVWLTTIVHFNSYITMFGIKSWGSWKGDQPTGLRET